MEDAEDAEDAEALRAAESEARAEAEGDLEERATDRGRARADLPPIAAWALRQVLRRSEG